jgi:hypothetical protein
MSVNKKKHISPYVRRMLAGYNITKSLERFAANISDSKKGLNPHQQCQASQRIRAYDRLRVCRNNQSYKYKQA